MPVLDRLLIALLLKCSAIFLLGTSQISFNDHGMLALPLSEFRFGQWANYGRLLFVLLLSIGGIYIAIAFRFGNLAIQFVAIVSELLLIVVTVTPTFNGLHELAANGLLALLFIYFGSRLYLVSSFWIAAHLIAPIVIVMGLMNYSLANFGMLQKSFICYLVIIVNLDCLLLTEFLTLLVWHREEKPKRIKKADRIRTPRVIYRRYS